MPRRNNSSYGKNGNWSNLPVPVVQPVQKESLRSSGKVFKDVAAHAAGVAAGSAVGHAIGAGITGLFRGHGNGNNARHSDLVEEGPCASEMKQFLKCTEESEDLNLCKEFNDAVRRCHKHYNI
ncbi:coiled-coil-helix-coiled-coil-helix domain-containing protein 2 [Drosophila kikkawai]|uniref:Coiled-coil-helix-coiled-coil-helix domain-containing protein 2 n=1 Tax=Drosophila kikkawai TaxID=30033 RepID=A0A6P4IEG9_DROKI|nr:coiled-coil-helix-coiled-coil-helix domain-containing protein 2 [Drosophila kikkawai]